MRKAIGEMLRQGPQPDSRASLCLGLLLEFGKVENLEIEGKNIADLNEILILNSQVGLK